MKKLNYSDFTVEFDDSRKVKDAVFDRVLKYYTDHEHFSGESLLQSDCPIIDAPDVFAEIADDIIKFKESYK